MTFYKRTYWRQIWILILKQLQRLHSLVFFAKNVNTFGLEYIDFSENSTVFAEEAKENGQ
jgi:hypothetical protein